MLKYISLVLIICTYLNSSWLLEYQSGLYEKDENKIYSLVQTDLENSKYSEIAFREALSDISTQLYSQVKSEQHLNKELVNDEFSKSFQNKIYIVSNLPIHGASKEKEIILNNKYYLLLTLDKNSIASTYKDKANELKIELDKIYDDYLNTDDLYSKENILNLLSSKLEKYEKYSFVAKILKQKDISKPKITPYLVEKALRNLYDVKVNSLNNLSKIISKKIFKNKINKTVKIFPFSYENSDTYSKLSYELKNYLENDLSKEIKITSSDDSKYKLSGNYFIQNQILTVKTSLYDENGEIIVTSLNEMNLNNLTKDYYIPKENVYKKMDELILDSNLDVQVRMNGSKKNLLFKNGESVNIEIKVSKEAYIYMIGNMRVRNNKQIQYLVPISDDSYNKSRFSKYIPYQNSNLWISIGEFDIQPPLGVEVLHVFASNVDMTERLPYTRELELEGSLYDVIIDNKLNMLAANESILKVRGLAKKKVKSKFELSETILKFTTVNK